jgi:hypothetical protein
MQPFSSQEAHTQIRVSNGAPSGWNPRSFSIQFLAAVYNAVRDAASSAAGEFEQEDAQGKE